MFDHIVFQTGSFRLIKKVMVPLGWKCSV